MKNFKIPDKYDEVKLELDFEIKLTDSIPKTPIIVVALKGEDNKTRLYLKIPIEKNNGLPIEPEKWERISIKRKFNLRKYADSRPVFFNSYFWNISKATFGLKNLDIKLNGKSD